MEGQNENDPKNITVIGAGHGGKAMAAHLALMGADVALWNRTFDHIAIIKKRGGIELESAEGGPHGFGKLSLVTSDMAEAIAHAPGDHGGRCLPRRTPILPKLAAPHLKDGQIVILHPGRTWARLNLPR